MSIFNLTKSIKLSKDFKALSLHHCIVALSSGMFGLFLPIFLLQEFNNSVYWVIVFYLSGYFLYALTAPLGAMLMQRVGSKKVMILARFFNVLFYACLYFLRHNPLLFAVLANLNLVIFRTLYWVPYHVEFARFTSGKYRGRQMAYLAILGYLIGVGAPLLAGLLLTQGSFEILFILAIAILMISVVPLKKLSHQEIKFDFSYKQTFKELFRKKYQRLRTAYFADGAQGLVGIIIWPIFIYQLLDGQYLAVGAVTALVVIGTVICQLMVGGYTDKVPKKKMMKLGSLIYATGWMAKMFVATALQIFVAGTFHSLGYIAFRTPFDAFSYEKFTDHGSYVDEYTVLREISSNFGRAAMGLVLLALVAIVGLKVAFPMAAVFSLFINIF
ncbi:MFS transporter [Patescibacteria group bacterium]|nr:MFS transporter [Patescibacteria group bacterium]